MMIRQDKATGYSRRSINFSYNYSFFEKFWQHLSLIPHSFVFSLTNRTFFFLIYLLTCNAFYLIIPKADILAMNMAFHNVIIFVLSQMLLIAQNIEIVINYFKYIILLQAY